MPRIPAAVPVWPSSTTGTLPVNIVYVTRAGSEPDSTRLSLPVSVTVRVVVRVGPGPTASGKVDSL